MAETETGSPSKKTYTQEEVESLLKASRPNLPFPTTEKSPEKKQKPEYLRPEFKPASELIWKRDSANRYRYTVALKALNDLLEFQLNHMPEDASEYDPGALEAWNKMTADRRNDIERIRAAEDNPYGWSAFTEGAKIQRFTDPDLQREFTDNVKNLKEKASFERTLYHKPAGRGRGYSNQTTSNRFRGRSNGGSRYRGRGYGRSSASGGGRRLCYNCGGDDHIGFQCPKPDIRNKWYESCEDFLVKENVDKDSNLAEWFRVNWYSLDNFSVKDSLSENVSAWEQVTDSPFILSVIKDGYKPPFKAPPAPKISKNNVSALQKPTFVLKSLGEALKNRCMRLVKEIPTVVNPLSVATQANGKERLICDLRHGNQQLVTQKFKLDDWPRVIPSLEPGMFGFAFDFQKWYYHVSIHPEFQQYFGISFSVNGETHYAVYTVGPFGLSTLPWLMTKLLKPWVGRWRGLGLNIFVYLDDGLAVCSSREEAEHFSNLVRQDLKRAGITEQPAKCEWEPKQYLDWLGLSVDFQEFCLVLPEAKRARALVAITSLVDRLREGNRWCSPRQLLSAAGQIISFAIVLGKECLIKTKPLFKFVSEMEVHKAEWDKQFLMTEEAGACLIFWAQYLPSCAVKRSLQREPVSAVLFSDASQSGGAAFIAERLVRKRAGCQVIEGWEASEVTNRFPSPQENPRSSSTEIALTSWDETECKQSSTWREVCAIDTSLAAWAPNLRGQHIKWFTDNTGGVSVIRKGSMVSALNDLAERIDKTCKNFGIDLEVAWIRRNKNKIADKLSRFVDLDDWGISHDLLRLAFNLWGKCSVDRFASDQNAKCIRFNSRFCCEGAEAIDAFAQDWRGEMNLLVPPPAVIPDCIQHLVHTGAKGTLIIPAWNTARFWPMLFPNGACAWFVKDFKRIEKGARFILEGKQPNSIFTQEKFKGALLLVLLDAGLLRQHGYS